jgi:hypothetical protein
MINDICIAWRKGSRRVWELPYNTHCFLLPLLGNCLPLLDEICRRSLNFIRSCFVHESNLIRFVATSAICFLRNNSFLGHNILFCMERYNCSLHDIITGNGNHIVNQYCKSLVDDDQLLTASFLSELIAIRDRRLSFSNGFFFQVVNCLTSKLSLHLVILLHFILYYFVRLS